MPGIEIKGRSKIANYRHGGRAGFTHGSTAVERGKIRREPHSSKKLGAKRVPGRKRKYESYTTDAGQLMVPMFNTRGQFRGYKEKKQTPSHKRNLEPELVRHIDKDKPTPVRSSRMDEERPEEVMSKGPARTQDKRSPTHPDDLRPEQAEGRRIGLKKGTDKKWIQKAVDPKHKGYCTPMTKKTCTPARKALARTFKKKAKTGWG